MEFIVPAIFGAIGLLLIAFSGWLWLRDPPRHLCPGALLGWRARLLPIWLIYQPRCAYDLTAHSPDAHGVIVCPECGRRVQRRRQMVRTPRAWKPGTFGCVWIVAGLLIHRYPPLAATTVVRHTPTEVLLRGEGFLGVGTPLEVRDEIRRRALDHQLTDEQTCTFVRLLVDDLRDDRLAGNAKDALERLSIFGILCPQPLVEALDSNDDQQRALAVRLLRSLPDDDQAPPSLLAACVEDLRSDDRLRNAKAAFRYLVKHAAEAEPWLVAAMSGADPQQRLLCAAVAGCGGRTDWMQQAVPILATHLADNQIEGDAIIAARALYGFGTGVLPMIEPLQHSADEQQRQAIEYTIRRMTTNESPATLQRELPKARLTRASRDALSLDPDYLDMPDF